jgi:hypothetical protein
MDRERDRELHRQPVGEPDATAPRGSVHWGSIWAGVLAAITTFLLLELLVIGIGLVTVGTSGDAGDWVSAIIGLIAFFIGGYLAGLTSSGYPNAIPGLLNGLLVWALGTVLVLALSAFGLGQLFGALGEMAGQLSSLSSSTPNPNVDPAQIAESVGRTALGAFFGLLLAALAAALGGRTGGRTGSLSR